jgi:1-acyl-sn-glycerol-3-phosphate acyltransferase
MKIREFKVLTLLRGILVLLVAPLLTALVSVTAIIMVLVFRRSAAEVQCLPRTLGRIVARLSGVSVSVTGLGHLEPGRPYIFAANHQSQFDIFVLQGFLGYDFRWLVKQELFKVPVFGKAMQFAGYIPVDRAHGRKALESLEEAAQRIADGTSVAVFPEGTRSPDGRLGQFKPGAIVLAIKAGVPVVPVAIVGTHQVLPKGRILVRPGRVEIRVGTPIATSEYTLKQKHELAERLQGKVSELLEVGAEKSSGRKAERKIEIDPAVPLDNVAQVRRKYLGKIKVLGGLLLFAIILGGLGVIFDWARSPIFTNTAFVLFVLAGFVFVYYMEELKEYKVIDARKQGKVEEFAREYREVAEYLQKLAATERKPVKAEYDAIVAFVEAKIEEAGSKGGASPQPM